MNLKRINEKQFNNLNIPCVFGNNNTDRCFALIRYQQSSFKFAWRSDLVSVDLLELKPTIYAIGIDENFAVVDFNLTKVVLYELLDFLFCEFKLIESTLLIATELQVFIMDLGSFQIKRRIDLPDTYINMKVIDSALQITCFDNVILRENL